MTAPLCPNLRERQLVLAVDLDGTFLGGSDAERRSLYDLIERRRDAIGLVFVTGRDIPFASGLAARGETPTPDMIIGDVGTSVVVGPEWRAHAAVEAWIEECWPGPDAAAAIMARNPNLRAQEVFGGRRLSYFYDDPRHVEAVSEEISAAGYQALSSADLYFDVLPPGVHKGATLLRVLQHENIARDRVLCAGDTMNDLSLFETGLLGVAVGNAEPRLRAAVSGKRNVYQAEREGAGGILEAIGHFEFLIEKETVG